MNSKKAEKQAKRQLKNRRKAEKGMSMFCKTFKQSVTFIENNDTIKMTQAAIKQKLSLYGHGYFFVLCCYFYNGRHVYRYIDNNNQLVSTFIKARAFKNEHEAIGVKNQVESEHPNKVFEITKL